MPGGFCFDTCCGTTVCNVIICVPRGGVVVTAKSGGTTIATGTTGAEDGCVVLNVGTAGTYTFHVAMHAVDSNYADVDRDITVNCGFTYHVNFNQFFVTGCQDGVGLAGATITVAGYASQTTGADGLVYFSGVPTGSYAYTVTHARFQTASGTWPGDVNAQIELGTAFPDSSGGFPGPATGYTCLPLFCNIPVSNTLNGTDAQLGAFTATYSSTLLLWEGIRTVNYAADPDCGCVARTGITIRYRWPNDAGTSDHRIQVAARLVSGCPAVGAVNTAFLPFTGGHSEACEPFDIVDQYDAGCGVGAIIWPAPPTNTVTLTE